MIGSDCLLPLPLTEQVIITLNQWKPSPKPRDGVHCHRMICKLFGIFRRSVISILLNRWTITYIGNPLNGKLPEAGRILPLYILALFLSFSRWVGLDGLWLLCYVWFPRLVLLEFFKNFLWFSEVSVVITGLCDFNQLGEEGVMSVPTFKAGVGIPMVAMALSLMTFPECSVLYPLSLYFSLSLFFFFFVCV